eukprot:3931611-Rhodomonas_salina.3
MISAPLPQWATAFSARTRQWAQTANMQYFEPCPQTHAASPPTSNAIAAPAPSCSTSPPGKPIGPLCLTAPAAWGRRRRRRHRGGIVTHIYPPFYRNHVTQTPALLAHSPMIDLTTIPSQ